MQRMTRLAAVLALALGGASAVHAAQQDPLSPQTGSWTIRPIPGGKFCSMKNTWDGGTRLVFARDAAGVNSLAVEFSGAPLEAGRQYLVTLDLPPLATRDMTSVAATRSILLVGMGKDSDFYAALSRAKGLYAETLNKAYGFDLAGSADALRELEVCASGLAEGRPVTAGKTASPELKTAQPAVRKTVKEKRNTETALRPVADTRGAEMDKAEALIARLKADLARAGETQKLADRLKAENGRLRGDMASSAGQHAEEKKELAGRIEALGAENTRLKNALAATSDARIKNAALDAENARLRQDLAAARAGTKNGEALAARVKTLEAENRRLKTALASAVVEKKEVSPAPAPRETLASAVHPSHAPIEAWRPRAERAEAAALPPPAVSVAEEDITGAILKDSGIVPKKKLASARGTGDVTTYTWTAGEVLGSAEETRVAPGEDFKSRVAGLLDRMAARCTKDFASKTALPETHGGVTMQEVEIACIGEKEGAAAALLFLSDGKAFTSVMHEAAPEDMKSALSGRDAVARALRRRAS